MNDRGSSRLSETARLEAFSDGVFAIAITLLILEIRLPADVEPGALGRALLHEWPSYLAFLASFVTIGVMWVNHHRLFTLIRRSDDRLMALNLLLLLGVPWVPFPTAVLAEHLMGADGRAAGLLYSGSFFAIAIVFNVLWRYATGGDRLVDAARREEIRSITRQYAGGPLLYAAAAVVAWFNATACLAFCAALAVYFAAPPRLWYRG